MIGLTDLGLAYLAAAAGRIKHSERGAWLQRLAKKLDPPKRSKHEHRADVGNKIEPPRRKPGARYTAAWRARAKAGRCLLTLEVDEVELAIALIDAGLLDARIADNRAALAAATQQALARFLAGEPSRRDAEICDSVKTELALTALQKALSHGSPKRVRK